MWKMSSNISKHNYDIFEIKLKQYSKKETAHAVSFLLFE